MNRSVSTYFSFLCTALLLLCHSLEAKREYYKEPIAIWLTWTQDPTTTMSIRWITPEENTSNTVEFCEFDPSQSYKARKRAGIVWNNKKGYHSQLSDVQYIIHKADLINLKPNQSYIFKLKTGKTVYKFKTMPQDLHEPVTFIVGGDTFDTISQFTEANRRAAIENPSFIVFGGDLAYSAGDASSISDDCYRWLVWLNTWTKTMISSSGYVIPLLVTLGNHETCGGFGKTPVFAKYFYPLFRTSRHEKYTSLRFSHYMHLILLDSGHTCPIDGEQTSWLESQLKSCQDVSHRFAVYHAPAYPSRYSFNNRESVLMRTHWCPVFEKYKLHAAFENHEHTYKRTHAIVDKVCNPNGVVYLGGGCWGVKPRSISLMNKPKVYAKTASSAHFIKVRISKHRREYWAITPTGQSIDYYSQNLTYSHD